MKSIRCKVCDRVFTAKGLTARHIGRLNANYANHMKGHGLNWRTGEKLVPKSPPEPEEQSEKRPYNRKAKEIGVCYCPKCGCNIRAVQVAMGL